MDEGPLRIIQSSGEPLESPGLFLSLQKENALLLGQQCILEMIATGAPLAETLGTLVNFIELQEPGVRCAILVLDEEGRHFVRGSGASLPARYHERVEGTVAAPPYRAPSAMAVHRRTAVAVPDIAREERFAGDWQELALSCGMRACLSTPVQASDRSMLGSFVLFYDQPRAMQAAAPRVVSIATHLASIALERARADATLRKSELEANALLMALPVALYTTDANGRLTFYNPAAAVLWGRPPALGKQRWCGSWRLFWPDGLPMPHDQGHVALALKEGRALCGEACVERPDGSRVPVIVYPMPLHDAGGGLTGSVNMLLDISERKRHDEQRLLLVNELNHRVKNTLATVLSIAVQTLSGEEPANEVLGTFEARIVALSKTHDILTRNHWRDASLRQVLEQELVPYGGKRLDRCVIEGDDFRLAPKGALALGLAFHELATNAAKYGALSCPDGRIEVSWSVCRHSPETVLRLVWRETGGPPVTPPRRRGFGLRLIERGLTYELDGEIQVHYEPAGLSCTIDIPLTFRARDALIAPSALP